MAEFYTPSGSSAQYTVPELTDPADAPQAFRDFADSIPDPLDTLTVSDVLDHVTLELNDDGTMLLCDTVAKGGDIEVTVPPNASLALPIGFTVAVSNLGGSAYKVKLKKGTGVTIQDQGFLNVEDYRTSVLVKVSTDLWLVQAGSSTYTPPSIELPAATGGTETTFVADGSNGVDGQTYKVHTFTSSGVLSVTANGIAECLVISGGGAGGNGGGSGAGGGGGGGAPIFASVPLVAGTDYTVTVGAGGASTGSDGSSGGTSFFFDPAKDVFVATIGGGGGGGYVRAGVIGACGGGGGNSGGQGVGLIGFNGTSSVNANAAGGGGMGSTGSGQDGGTGIASSISGTSVTYCGGGGAGGNNAAGTGYDGGANSQTSAPSNRGGGGGGARFTVGNPGNGGSGIVIVRYPI